MVKKIVVGITLATTLFALVSCGKPNPYSYNPTYPGTYATQDPYKLQNPVSMTNPNNQLPNDPNITTPNNNNPPGQENNQGQGNENSNNPNPQPSASPSATPTPSASPQPSASPEFSTGGYTADGNFKTDRDFFNEWQAIGVAIKGNTLYVAAVDQTGIFKKGTVLKMDSNNGQNWKDLGSTLLGLNHPIKKSIKGVAVDKGQNLFAVDSEEYLYSLLSPKYNIKKAKAGSGAIDIVSEGSYLFVATAGGLKKYSADLTGGATVGSNINFTGGIGSDGKGNIYGICGTVIKKIEITGNATDIISGIDSTAIDVVVDNQDNVLVLTDSGINKYTNGRLVAVFGEGSFTKAASIAVDESKNVYVADTGTNNKDSKIIKYSTNGLSTQSVNFISTMNDDDVN